LLRKEITSWAAPFSGFFKEECVQSGAIRCDSDAVRWRRADRSFGDA
jgi:hypothetical protein